MKQPILFRRVVGKSMTPKLRPGQLIVATSIFRRLHAGQVVVLRKNGKELVKRIEQVADGKVFVVGDNLAGSTDSRHFGWLDLQVVVARVFWPKLAK